MLYTSGSSVTLFGDVGGQTQRDTLRFHQRGGLMSAFSLLTQE